MFINTYPGAKSCKWHECTAFKQVPVPTTSEKLRTLLCIDKSQWLEIVSCIGYGGWVCKNEQLSSSGRDRKGSKYNLPYLKHY